MRSRRRARCVAAAIFAVLFVLLLPAAITATWIRHTVLSTSGYVAAVAPVADDPAVRAAVRGIVAGEVDLVLDHAVSALPPAVDILAGPLSSSLTSLAGDATDEVLASPAFRQLWATANTSAHDQLISILNGSDAAVATTGGEVVLNLAPLISDVLKAAAGRLSELTGSTVTLPAVSDISATTCRQIADITRTHLSAGCGQIPLFQAAGLSNAQRVFRVLRPALVTLLILTPAAGAAALLVAPRRRRVLLLMTIGGTVAVLAASIAISRLRSNLGSRAQPAYQPVVTTILHALTSSFFTLARWSVLCALMLAAAALLSVLHFRSGIGPARSRQPDSNG